MTSIQEIQDKLIRGFIDKMENIIKTRIIELGLPLDKYISDMKESKIRFNPYLKCDYPDGSELIYYNDGSDNGLFVIGFYPVLNQLDYGTNLKIERYVYLQEPDFAKL
jgi:hypothetical protein